MPQTHLPRSVLLLFALIAAATVHQSPLAAQKPIPESRSALVGVVVDPSHAAMPGVGIELEDLARRVTRRATTDRQGRFEFRELPAGDYEAEIVVPGFTAFREPILLAGPLVEREIVLSLGVVEETYTVTAGTGAAAATPGEKAGRQQGEVEPCVARVDPDTQSPVGGQIRPPRMLERVAPIFPDHLREADLDGTVRLTGRITAEGTMSDLVVAEASHPDFAAAAEDAVRVWTWEQSLLNCTPVDVPATITVRFVPQRQ